MGFAWLFLFFSLFVLVGTTKAHICPFDSIYQFGDSISDTGNNIRIQQNGLQVPSEHFPYGITFPGMPTGRFSDGRLIADFVAMGLGLPLLNPYLDQNASFTNGVNFAVAGATALDPSSLVAMGVKVPNVKIIPLSTQLNWFRTYLGSICSTPAECSNKLKNTLFIVGNIGNNDVNYALASNITVEEHKLCLTSIAEAVANVTREIIRLGGTRVIIPGTFPFGCLPRNLNLFPDGDKDDLGCLSSLNILSTYFNERFQEALASLRTEFPEAVIIYADYDNALRYLLRNGPALGFNSTSLLQSCCGIGGLYNYDPKRECGSPEVPLCPNPAQYIQWDGTHLTQAAHHLVIEYLAPDILKALKCSYTSIRPFVGDENGRNADHLSE